MIAAQSPLPRKRSRSDMDDSRESLDIQLPIQFPTRPATPVERDEVYNLQVLSLGAGRTEEDLDRQYLVTAMDLGIPVSQDTMPSQEPMFSQELIADDLSALTVSSSIRDPSSILSRTSESTAATSCSSSQQQLPTAKVDSPTISPMATKPPSIFSTKSTSYVKIRQGLRRLSTITRRRTLSSNTIPTFALLVQPTPILVKLKVQERPLTADANRPPSTMTMRAELAPPRTSSLPMPKGQAEYRSMTPPTEERDLEEISAARDRSLNSSRLQRLRAHQLEEQRRFLRFQEEQKRLVNQKWTVTRRDIIDRYHVKQRDLQHRHLEVMTDLEHRHLTAELDLSRSLEAERRAVETRLRHMEAYCKNITNNMPRRKVTEEDYKKLLYQYNTRDGLDNLHEARINVLREKQAKQLERISAKQASEEKLLDDQKTIELERYENEFRNDEFDLRQEFEERKQRLVKRWVLAEAIERRKLDKETGERHAECPEIMWPEDWEDGELQEMPVVGKQAFWKAAVVLGPVGGG
jgi:hypothetical protein